MGPRLLHMNAKKPHWIQPEFRSRAIFLKRPGRIDVLKSVALTDGAYRLRI